MTTLIEETQRWIGTPWCANSEVPGERGGVSCHNLPRAIYVATGVLDESFPRIVGFPNRHARESVMERFLDSRPELRRLLLETSNAKPETIRPGDLLGLRLCRCIDHLGLALGSHEFIHVLMHKRTTIDRLDDPTWSSRLLAVWRPVILS